MDNCHKINYSTTPWERVDMNFIGPHSIRNQNGKQHTFLATGNIWQYLAMLISNNNIWLCWYPSRSLYKGYDSVVNLRIHLKIIPKFWTYTETINRIEPSSECHDEKDTSHVGKYVGIFLWIRKTLMLSSMGFAKYLSCSTKCNTRLTCVL